MIGWEKLEDELREKSFESWVLVLVGGGGEGLKFGDGENK